MITKNSYKNLTDFIKERTNDKNPVLSSELEARFSLVGPEVRELIRLARRNKIPIANHHKGGYFLAHDYEDVKDTVDDLKNRAQSMIKTARALEECFPQR